MPTETRNRSAATKPITERQRRWVEAYMGAAKGNATEAARLAGYRGNAETLRQVGHENLTKPHVRAAVAARVAADPRVKTREELQLFLSQVIDDPRNKLCDRLTAVKLLARTQGIFVDRHIVESGAQAQVVLYLPDNGRGPTPAAAITGQPGGSDQEADGAQVHLYLPDNGRGPVPTAATEPPTQDQDHDA
jgi:hypothetical protein